MTENKLKRRRSCRTQNRADMPKPTQLGRGRKLEVKSMPRQTHPDRGRALTSQKRGQSNQKSVSKPGSCLKDYIPGFIWRRNRQIGTVWHV